MNIAPEAFGAPSWKILTSTAQAVVEIGSNCNYRLSNSAPDICYVAIDRTPSVLIDLATALPIAPGGSVTVAVGEGSNWIAARLASGTGLLWVVQRRA